MTSIVLHLSDGVNKKALVWLLLLASILGAFALLRLQLTYDLGFFLPPPQSDEQQLLIERLGQGPGTQLIFIVLPNTDQTSADLAGEQIRKLTGVARVLPDDQEAGIQALPQVLWQHRLLLGDLPTTREGWLEVLDERVGDIMLADEDLQSLITQDPALLSLNAIEQATSAVSQPNFVQSADTENNLTQQRFLLVQTKTGAFDLDQQHNTVTEIRTNLRERGITNATLYGSGVYGVDLQNSVQSESIVFSGLASLALAALVFLRFRRWLLVLAVGVPLLVGGLAGLAALAVFFTDVHGITLAFGFTLLGVAIDYPLHLLSHTTQASNTRKVWPTLSLGIGSTLVAYCAFALSGTTGMQQLGVFAGTGIGAAAIASWWLTSTTSGTKSALAEPASNKQLHAQLPMHLESQGQPNHWPWCICLLLGLVLLSTTKLFSDDLSRLTPVPQSTLAEDARIRKAMGVADIRHLLSVRHTNLQDTLEHLEQANVLLEQAIARGELTGYQNISSLLPSNATQARRRESAQNLLKNGSFQQAVEQSGFAPDGFTGFTNALAKLADTAAPNLNLPDLLAAPGELPNLVDSMLYKTNNQWVALTFLRGLPDSTDALASQLHSINGARLVDLKQASKTLVADYRTRIFTLLGLALGAIAVLLLTVTRRPARVIWLIGTLLAALVVSLGVGRLLLGGLSLFDCIALALVAGLGLDYALFFSKRSTSIADRALTHRAITLCALSSLFVFTTLALSSIPLLRGLGITVASGVAAAWLFARLGWHPSSSHQS